MWTTLSTGARCECCCLSLLSMAGWMLRLRFAKWRATIKVQPGGPSELAVAQNADELAQYAKICQVGQGGAGGAGNQAYAYIAWQCIACASRQELHPNK